MRVLNELCPWDTGEGDAENRRSVVAGIHGLLQNEGDSEREWLVVLLLPTL